MALLSIPEFADFYGKSPRYIRKLIDEGKIRTTATGKINPRLALKDIKENGVGQRKKNGKGPSSYTLARVEVENWIAKLKQLQYEKLAGTLVSAAAVEKEWTRILTVLRTRLLAMPRTMAAVMVTCKTPAEAEAKLMDYIISALEDISVELSTGHGIQ